MRVKGFFTELLRNEHIATFDECSTLRHWLANKGLCKHKLVTIMLPGLKDVFDSTYKNLDSAYRNLE